MACRIPAALGDIGERAVAIVVVENIFAALEAGRTAGHHHALVEARARFRHGRGRQIQIDVVGDEQIELAVAVVVHKCAAGVPALAIAGDAGLLAHIGERAVAVVVVENILAEVGDEQIFEAVVVVVADADALSPAGVRHAGLRGDVGEGAVAIVLEQMRGGFLSGREAFQTRAVHQENIQPAVVVVVVESDAAAGGLQQIFVLVLAAVDGFGVESGFAGDVDEAQSQAGCRVLRVRRRPEKMRATGGEPAREHSPGKARAPICSATGETYGVKKTKGWYLPGVGSC